MLGALLDELRPSGEVVQHKLGNGPWVTSFADARAQQQALGKNSAVLQGSMIGVIEGIHPASSAAGLGDAGGSRSSLEPASAAGIPLRIQQTRTVGPSLRAPPVARRELGKAGWWTVSASMSSGGNSRSHVRMFRAILGMLLVVRVLIYLTQTCDLFTDLDITRGAAGGAARAPAPARRPGPAQVPAPRPRPPHVHIPRCQSVRAARRTRSVQNHWRSVPLWARLLFLLLVACARACRHPCRRHAGTNPRLHSPSRSCPLSERPCYPPAPARGFSAKEA